MSKWNWKKKREKAAFLALENGSVLHGYSVGASINTVGEVVFNTGMSGYQEILTDPSYTGQFVTMTYPEIGNTGINSADMESIKMFLSGFIIHEMNSPSNWRQDESLRDSLIKNNIPAIAGIDTRALTSLLRKNGTLKGHIVVKDNINENDAVSVAKNWEGLDNLNYAERVTCKSPYQWDEDDTLTKSWGITEDLPPADLTVVAYDFGIKWNILRSMRRSGMKVTVVPVSTPAKDVLAMKPDGVFLSNGPGDPDPVKNGIEAAKLLLGKVPMMGICLGHQILGLSLGGKRYRLKFGHHGCNHPVMDLSTSKVEITSQNHNFAIDSDSLKGSDVEVTHINLNDQTVEGLRHKTEPMFCVQYHPEASPGPHDPFYLFARFREMIESA